MTRNEAIKLLLESKDNEIERSLREWEEWDKRYFEAIDMAIEALKEVNYWHGKAANYEQTIINLSHSLKDGIGTKEEEK